MESCVILHFKYEGMDGLEGPIWEQRAFIDSFEGNF